MGIVREQAVKNSIISYAGVVLGYVNIIILFPAFFTTEQFGLIQLLVSLSFIYAQLSAVGLVNGINRYFPFFKTEDKTHNAFLSYVMLICVAGFIASTAGFLIFRNIIISSYIEKSKLFTDFYFVLLPLSLFALVFNIIEALVRIVYKTVFATLLKEVVLRLLTTAGIILYVFNVIDFDYFVYFYTGTYILVAIIIFGQMLKSGEFKIAFTPGKISFDKLKDITKYGFYNLLSGSAMFVGQKIDIIMIGSMVGLQIVGVYSLYLYVASVIYIPMRALSRISVPIISNAWKENDIPKINEIYRKTSLIQTIVGLLIYIGVIINRHNLFLLLKKPEYVDNFGIFYFTGIAILIDISVGLNSEIIANSSKYRYDTLFNIILFVTSVIMNLIFIPKWGGIGAAVALIVTFFVFNLLKSIFLFRKYNMQPLDPKLIAVLLISGASFLAGEFFPVIGNLYADIFVRSALTSSIFLSLIYFFRISPEINQRYGVYLNFIKNKFFSK